MDEEQRAPESDEYPLRSDDPIVAAYRYANLMEAWHASGVTARSWADAIGRPERTLRAWNDKHVTPGRLDTRQVDATCALFRTSRHFLLHGMVEQPGLTPIITPTGAQDAEPGRYIPDKARTAYARLSHEAQRKATAYIADLLAAEADAERADRYVQRLLEVIELANHVIEAQEELIDMVLRETEAEDVGEHFLDLVDGADSAREQYGQELESFIEEELIEYDGPSDTVEEIIAYGDHLRHDAAYRGRRPKADQGEGQPAE